MMMLTCCEPNTSAESYSQLRHWLATHLGIDYNEPRKKKDVNQH